MNASVLANPSAFNVKEKPAKITRSKAVDIQIRFGLRSTAFPIFAQVPLNCSSTSSNFGIFGQNIQRPLTKRSLLNKLLSFEFVTRLYPEIISNANKKAGINQRKFPLIISTIELITVTSKKINPKITLGSNNIAGKNVRTVSIAIATPIAPTGPNPRLPDRSLNRRTNNPAITVEPDAKIGSITPLSETFIASYLDS